MTGMLTDNTLSIEEHKGLWKGNTVRDDANGRITVPHQHDAAYTLLCHRYKIYLF